MIIRTKIENTLNGFQSRFKNRKNTQDHIFMIKHTIDKNGMQRGKRIVLRLIDLEKAL